MANAGQAIQQKIYLNIQRPILKNAGVLNPITQNATTTQRQNA